ncbi:MAG: methyltransferase [Sphingobacteriales bacterium]|nr:MAG: methyltransferase [Sphingobacteriales bacterium]
MVGVRGRYQGTWNIIRFNRHFYVLALLSVSGLIVVEIFLEGVIGTLMLAAATVISLSTVISLAVSLWVYDLSGFYKMNWIRYSGLPKGAQVFNIHAGFDETSSLLSDKFPLAKLTAYDFYDPIEHTEISIKRARTAYPSFPGTQKISTKGTGLPVHKADMIFLIFSLHEIRNTEERRNFLRTLKGLLTSEGRIIVVEHQRDLPNFIAFNVGFFHFYSPASWMKDFNSAGLLIERREAFTPFVNLYTLIKNDSTS